MSADGEHGTGPGSPLVAVLDRLRSMNPRWSVALGVPEGDGWIDGVDLTRPDEGPFGALLTLIGDRLRTSNRKVIAASLALRFGWSSAAAIGPFLVARCVPDLALENISLKFSSGALFERVAVHVPRATVLAGALIQPNPHVTTAAHDGALLAALRNTLLSYSEPVVESLYRWSRFPARAIWGQVMSSWGSPWMQVLASTRAASVDEAIRLANALFDDSRAPFRMRPRFYPVTCGPEEEAHHRRASCCLYYRLPTGTYCSSCPLIPYEESVRRNVEFMRKKHDAT